MRLTAPLALAALMTVSSLAEAADLAAEVPEAIEYRDIILDLGIGVSYGPSYPAADEYEVSPWPIVRLRFLRLPIFGEVVTGEPSVFSLYPSLDVIGERPAGGPLEVGPLGPQAQPFRANFEQALARAVPSTDLAVELGGGAALQYGFLRGFAEVRYGFFGHDGFVAEAGIDAVGFLLDGRLELRAGPRVSLASDNFMDTYFGVNRVTRADVGIPGPQVIYPGYDPDGGFKDVGAEISAIYAITDNLLLHGRAEYNHFVGDALDSPIVKAGNEQDFTVGIGLSYRFGLDLY